MPIQALEESIAQAVELVRGARVVVEMPSHVAWVTPTTDATAGLTIERKILQTLAGRLPVSIPASAGHRGHVSVPSRVSSRPGLEHHEFRWLPSYGEANLAVALAIYREKTSIAADVPRLRRGHARAALEQYGWGPRAAEEHQRTEGTLAQTRARAECAVADCQI